MKTIVTSSQAEQISKRLRKRGKKVGLVFGCFDILHMGHINLFRFSKKYCDFLIVALNGDKSIKISKPNRPIFKFKDRAEALSELKSVDLVFEIKESFNFHSPKAQIIVLEILKKLKPDYLFSSSRTDKFWKLKKKLLSTCGGTCIPFRKNLKVSTTFIASEILKNH